MAKKMAGNRIEDKMIRSIDDLAEFEDFQDAILPRLRKAMRAGKTGAQIYAMFKDMAAARKVSIALDPRTPVEKALSAIESIENRVEGKPTERKQHEHKYSQLPDSQLDALILSESDDEDGDDGTPGPDPEGSGTGAH